MQKINNWLWNDKKTTLSTNDDALDYIFQVAGERFIISAATQTQGRGRLGRRWHSMEGNLFFSQGLCFPIHRVGELVIASSLSLYQTIRDLIPSTHKVQIKWPNDILIDNAKVSGCLLEKGDKDYIIIGIGVNIYNFPTEDNINYPTTSLFSKGINIDRLAFLQSYITNFDNNYDFLCNIGFSAIKEQWLSVVKGLGEKIIVQTTSEYSEGIFQGIGDNGELLLKIDNAVKPIYAGDVFYIKKE